MPQNKEVELGGAGAVAYGIVILIDMFAKTLSTEQMVGLTAAIGTAIAFVIRRWFPPKKEPVVLTQVVEEPGQAVATKE